MLPLPPPNSQKTDVQKTDVQKRLGLGFRQPQATMREFVILLILLFGSYTALHIFIPSNSSLSLFKIKNSKTRSPILEQVGLLKEDLRNKENTFLSQTSQTTPAKDTNENSLLSPKTIEKWKEELSKTNISEKEKKYLTDLSSDFSTLLKQLESKDIKKENLSILFLNINKNLVNFESSLENSLEKSLFWSGNGKWLEVIFWSLIGTLLFIIQQTSEYYLASNSASPSANKINKVNKVLTRRKPQYYYFLFQSPFTALVILWILSMANLSIAGIGLALSSAPSEVLISLAFILGLYNRVANTQLNLIVKGIFGEAWTKTVRKIEIQQHGKESEPGELKIKVCYDECVDFDVLPDVKVRWSIISKPSVGIIDESTGTYIAPPENCYYDESKELKQIPKDEDKTNGDNKTTDKIHGKNYTQDIVQAVREDEESVSAIALIILTPASSTKQKTPTN